LYLEEERNWRLDKMYNEKLPNVHSSSNIIRVINARRMRRSDHLELMAQMRNAYRILVKKPEWKTSECEDVDWIKLAQDRDRWQAVVNTVINLRIP
jgi:hypothetical protein